MNLKLYTIITLFAASATVYAQDPAPKDNNKIQEVVTLDGAAPALAANADGTAPADTTTPVAKPLGSGEIVKRAVNWVKLENPKYVKSNGVNSGSKAECQVTFKYKPKELNPQADVEGTVTMHISIEAKDGKYRYTVSKISHTAKNKDLSGGDLYNDVPACGSIKLPPDLWKKIKSEGMKDVGSVCSDLKEAMKVSSDTPLQNPDEW